MENENGINVMWKLQNITRLSCFRIELKKENMKALNAVVIIKAVKYAYIIIKVGSLTNNYSLFIG